MAIKAVLFDLWGTLVFNDSHHSKRDEIIEIIGEKNKKEFKKLLFNWWFTNNVTEEVFFTKMCTDLNIDKSKIPNLVKIWKEQYEHAKPFHNTIEILEELKSKGIKTGLVTNTSPYAKGIITNLNLDKLFDVMVFSCDVGVIKPDKKIYKIALKKLKLEPQECLFIGDDIKNDVGGPRSVGMKSFLINRKYHSEDNIQNLSGVLDLLDWE